jgi:hypothetical protein
MAMIVCEVGCVAWGRWWMVGCGVSMWCVQYAAGDAQLVRARADALTEVV